MLALSFRMTWRDWRSGELYFLLLALIIAVAALCSVGFFTDRIESALQRDANQLLGGDLVISADWPITTINTGTIPRNTTHSATHNTSGNHAAGAAIDHLIHSSTFAGLQQAGTVSFVSMAANANESQSKLVAIKAVTPTYPIRGKITLQDELTGQAIPSSSLS